MSAGLPDIDRLADLAEEVDATRRLVVANQLVGEILDRLDRINDRINELNGGDPGAGSPTRLDRIMELSDFAALSLDLEGLADRICVRADVEPPSVEATYSAILDQLTTDELDRACSAAAGSRELP